MAKQDLHFFLSLIIFGIGFYFYSSSTLFAQRAGVAIIVASVIIYVVGRKLLKIK
jgi:hypothetical protein